MALSRLLKFWIYRVNQASNTFCSPASVYRDSLWESNYGRLFWRWDLGEVSAEFDCLSLFSPDLSNQRQETVTFSSQVAILFGVFHCRAIFSLPKKTFQDLLKTKLKKHRQVLFSKPGLFILGKFCPSRWEGKSKTFLYLSISSNAFEYTFCETS